MSSVRPEKQYLLHTLSVVFCRPPYVRSRVTYITGRMMLVCKHTDLQRIMLHYKDIASYCVVRVEDTSNGQEYPDLRTDIILNEKEI